MVRVGRSRYVTREDARYVYHSDRCSDCGAPVGALHFGGCPRLTRVPHLRVPRFLRRLETKG